MDENHDRNANYFCAAVFFLGIFQMESEIEIILQLFLFVGVLAMAAAIVICYKVDQNT